ncbi:UNVERIFIED_CONTAM: Flavin mononucleotide hydrolase 1, chloroplatic [Sesamum calycinum]|uniref:Flavin mononucleotide hydrolase 1, chloroplatic n=1 Tax=Sesamum calycinum TaxID=2727403 RepID=A0AAW2LIQ0_9LAMI
MRRGYSYIEGVEALLIDLKKSGYEMHAFTNYPIWYEIIEEKLKLSTYLSWTFCSCIMGKRKPDPNLYMDILKHLKIEPACCIFIDDRLLRSLFMVTNPSIGFLLRTRPERCSMYIFSVSSVHNMGEQTYERPDGDRAATILVEMDPIEEEWFLPCPLAPTRHSCVTAKGIPGMGWSKYGDIKGVGLGPSNKVTYRNVVTLKIREKWMKNVEAALDAGFIGIQFKNVDSLRSDLGRLGIVMETI